MLAGAKVGPGGLELPSRQAEQAEKKKEPAEENN